jgi:hypothetical protein
MRQSAVNIPGAQDAANSTGSTTYVLAVNAARNAKLVVGTETRRKWILGLQANERQADNAVYTAEGENAEILVLTSNSMDSSLCTSFAKGDSGSAAAREGFTAVSCRSRTTDGVYDVPLVPTR